METVTLKEVLENGVRIYTAKDEKSARDFGNLMSAQSLQFYSTGIEVVLLHVKPKQLNEAEQTLFEYLRSKGVTLSVGEIKDFQLIGDESDPKIREYANDYLSECASDEAEYRAHKKMGNYYDN